MKLSQHRIATALALCAMALIDLSAHAQTSNTNNIKDDLFVGTEKFAKGASDIEEITMDHDTLNKVGSQASGMVLNVVHTYSYPKPGLYNIADVDEFRNKLNTGDWHCSVHISHPLKGESTDVCERHRTDNMHESAIITVEPRQLTFIHKITRDRTSGGQSYSSFPDASVYASVYAGTYSGAELKAELAIASAELRASMAGKTYSSWSGSYTPPAAEYTYERLSAEHTRRLADELKRSSDAGTQVTPQTQKSPVPNQK